MTGFNLYSSPSNFARICSQGQPTRSRASAGGWPTTTTRQQGTPCRKHRQHKPYVSNPARECLASRLISSEKAAPRWLAGGNARGRTEPSGVAVVTITSPGPIAGPGGDWSKRRLVRHIKACLFDASAIPEIPGTGVLLPPRRVAVAGSAFAKYDVKQRRRSYQAHALSLPWRVPKLLAAPVEVSIGHQALVEPTADLLHWSSDLKAAACVR
jgi:hypothetical protein